MPNPSRQPAQPHQHHRRRETLFDLLTFLFVLGSVAILGVTFLIIANPQAPFNPFPPPDVPEVLQLPTWTPTPTITPTSTASPTATTTPLPPTPTASQTPTESPTPTETPTPTPTFTPVLLLPTNTPDPSIPQPDATGGTVQAGIVFSPPETALQPAEVVPFAFIAGEPVYQRNVNESGCQWLSIAGDAVGLFGEPTLNIPVEVTGPNFTEVQFTGSATQFGPAGFEINVGTSPRATTFAIRLLSPSGESLSDYVLVTTGDTCDRNVALITFQQVNDYE